MAVGVTPVVMLSVLPDVLAEFRQLMPAAKIKITEGLLAAVHPALRNGTLDFALASQMPGRDVKAQEFDFDVLRPLDFMIACRRGHPLARTRRWEQLRQCEWLLNVSRGSHTEAFLEGLRAHGLQAPDHIIECDTFGVMWHMMTRSDALIVCPSAMLNIAPHGAEAARIRVDVPMPVASIGILTLRGTPLSMAASRLCDVFRRKIARAM